MSDYNFRFKNGRLEYQKEEFGVGEVSCGMTEWTPVPIVDDESNHLNKKVCIVCGQDAFEDSSYCKGCLIIRMAKPRCPYCDKNALTTTSRFCENCGVDLEDIRQSPPHIVKFEFKPEKQANQIRPQNSEWRG